MPSLMHPTTIQDFPHQCGQVQTETKREYLDNDLLESPQTPLALSDRQRESADRLQPARIAGSRYIIRARCRRHCGCGRPSIDRAQGPVRQPAVPVAFTDRTADSGTESLGLCQARHEASRYQRLNGSIMLKKSRRTLRCLACSILALALGACSSNMLESPKIDYKSASKREQNPLEIPPDLTTPTRDDRYVVPDVAPKGTATYSAYSTDRAQPQATNTDVLPAADKMRIERSGTQRWLVVQGTTPDKVWPIVKEFWLETGFILVIDRPDLGVMETDWAEDRAKIPQDIIRSTIGKEI